METSDIESSASSPECGEQSRSDEEKQTNVKIKEEPPDRDIKNYAETTMNELLGWYGYEKVNSHDTELLNLHKYTSTSGVDSEKSQLDENESREDDSVDDGIEDTLSEDSHITTNSLSDSENGSSFVSCTWCQKPGGKLFTQKTSAGIRAFCSEVCFTQCRRASFKKNKVCDWCKHVRHTVNYVDFQDGEQQLQFCCAKCLNQYKMKIFCKETQEHLKQIKDKADRKSPIQTSGDKSKILITPDLWMKEAETSDKKKENDDKKNLSNKDIYKLFKHAKTKRDSVSNDTDKGIKNKQNSNAFDDIIRAESANSIVDKRSKESKQSLTRSTEKSVRETVTPHNAPVSISPQTNNGPVPLNPFQLNPSLTGLNPWMPPQLCGTFGAGLMSQFSTFPPWCFPGMFPAIPGFSPNGQMVPPTRSDALNNSSNGHRGEQNRRPNMLQEDDRLSQSPGVSRHSAVRRAKLHGTHVQMQPTPAPLGNTNNNLVPPVTMIMPVPVALPLPIPIPLPLPLKLEDIQAVFNAKKGKTDTENSMSGASGSQQHGAPEYNLKTTPQFSPRKLSPIVRYDHRSNDSVPSPSLTSERSCSVVSCPELVEAHDLSVRKRSLTPKYDDSLDLSKRRHISESDSLDSSNGAIDLSKDGILSRQKNSPGKENRELNDLESSLEADHSVEGDSEIKIPRIHIITPKTEPPLCQELPLPPTVEDKYSKRRGLILDAPRVPKRPKSPSPERRTYVRSIPRDVMEAARRRCLRARIRTK